MLLFIQLTLNVSSTYIFPWLWSLLSDPSSLPSYCLLFFVHPISTVWFWSLRCKLFQVFPAFTFSIFLFIFSHSSNCCFFLHITSLLSTQRISFSVFSSCYSCLRCPFLHTHLCIKCSSYSCLYSTQLKSNYYPPYNSCQPG